MEFIFGSSVNGYKILMIFWNIFLALVPCFLVYFLSKIALIKKWSQLKRSDSFIFLLIFLFWFFFFPNTAYLFTMPRHLVDYCSDYDRYRVCAEESWMVILFFAYAAIGIPTFYYALNRMNVVLGKIFNKKLATAFPILMIPLTSIGILLGLIDRYNSWEIFMKPLIILKSSISYFTDKTLFLNFLVFTIILYLIYYGLLVLQKND